MSFSATDEKRILRKKYLKLRNSFSCGKINEASKKICEIILSSDLFRCAKTVLLYSCTGSEIDLTDIATTSFTFGKTVCFPVCRKDSLTMSFKAVSSLGELSCGAYGIFEPSSDLTDVSPSLFTRECICFVPGIVFDKSGFRLGYGKGYYDRFLQTFEGIAVGIAYDDLTVKSLPFDMYDRKTDFLVTESGIFNTKI